MKKIHGIEALVISKLLKFGDGSFKCFDCVYTSKVKACVKIHIESNILKQEDFRVKIAESTFQQGMH